MQSVRNPIVCSLVLFNQTTRNCLRYSRDQRLIALMRTSGTVIGEQLKLAPKGIPLSLLSVEKFAPTINYHQFANLMTTSRLELREKSEENHQRESANPSESRNMKRLTVAIALTCGFVLTALVAVKGQQAKANLWLSVAQIAKLRQFQAEEHYVTTTDGYKLQLTRISNPKIKVKPKNKAPLLLVHGILVSGAYFVTNSLGATPKDYSGHDASKMSEAQLDQLLANDPASNSIAFLAANFGHEVWILNRRGVGGSTGYSGGGHNKWLHINQTVMKRAEDYALATIKAVEPDAKIAAQIVSLFESKFSKYARNPNMLYNSAYWDFSLDNQAKYDIPEVIDYVLATSGHQKLDIIGHSAGGALTLMALITKPSLANKINKALLWAPALYLNKNPNAATNRELLLDYTGPVPAEPLNKAFVEALGEVCAKTSHEPFCQRLFDALYGKSNNQMNIIPENFVMYPSSESSHDMLQLNQVPKTGIMHTFDHYDAAKNKAAYGSAVPIPYDVAKIQLRQMSFWYGTDDSLVPAASIERLMGDLKVPFEKHLLHGQDLHWNHVAFLYHRQVAKQLNIPCLKAL